MLNIIISFICVLFFGIFIRYSYKIKQYKSACYYSTITGIWIMLFIVPIDNYIVYLRIQTVLELLN